MIGYIRKYKLLFLLLLAAICVDSVFLIHIFKNTISDVPFALAGSNDIFTITATAGFGGSISPFGSVPVNNGESQSFTITANSGYGINNVLVDNSSVGPQTSYTFLNVTSDHTISAIFTPLRRSGYLVCGSNQKTCGEQSYQICCLSDEICSGTPASPVCTPKYPECGTANKTYPAGSTGYGNDTFCSIGTPNPANPAFPAPGKIKNWICEYKTSGQGQVYCSAKLSLPPPPPPSNKDTHVFLHLNIDYVKETEKRRKFTPPKITITPIDNIDCVLKIPISDDTGGGPKKTYKGYLYALVEENNKKQALRINNGKLYYKTSDAYYNYYVWTIDGWYYNTKDPNDVGINTSSFGITDSASSYRSLLKSGRVFCGVDLDSRKPIKGSEIKPVSLCARLWGDSEKNKKEGTSGYKVGVLRSQSVPDIFPPNKIVREMGVKVLDRLFLKPGTDPFKKYKNNFAVYLDLKPYDDYDDSESAVVSNIDRKKTECSDMDVFYLSTTNTGQWRAFFINNGNTIKMEPYYFFEAAVAHELGHFFDLSDEYVYKGLIKPTPLKTYTNCDSSKICSRFFKNPYYEDGCHKGCTNNSYFRSTENSVMKSTVSGSTLFNAISCSVILSHIKEGEFNPSNRVKNIGYFTECDGTMDVDREGECKDDMDCNSTTNGLSSGCGKCWPGKRRKCIFSGEGADCRISISYLLRQIPGVCLKPVSGREKGNFYCDAMYDWKCNSLVSCPQGETCVDHKCVK